MPIVAEILAGVELSDSRDANLGLIERELKLLRLWPFDLAAAHSYVKVFGKLIRQGVIMQPIDLMTAAVALTIPRCTVLTNDSDFSRVPGLQVENWEQG